MPPAPIELKDLRLAPYAPVHLRALIEGVEPYMRSFGWPPAEGLRDFYLSAAVSPEWLAKLEGATEANPWVHGFGVVHKASGTVIGAAGFKGPPDANGVVEIAYGIVPAFQGRGYATEAARGMMEFACADPRVRTLRAHTLPQTNASTRVLAKCGFRHLGEVMDPEDGLVWRWERPAESRAMPA